MEEIDAVTTRPMGHKTLYWLQKVPIIIKANRKDVDTQGRVVSGP